MDRFTEIFNQYQQFKEQYQAGSLDKDAFQRAVEGLAFTDDQGQNWQIGVSSGEWYRLEGGEWVKASPPAPASQTSAPPPPPAASSSDETPQYDFGDPAPAPPPAPVDSSPPPPPTSSFDEAPQYDFGDSEEQAPKKKKKKRRGCLIIGLILAAVLLCVGTIYVGSNLLDGEWLNFDFESSSLLGDEETLIVIDNQTSYEICAVYISPTTSDDWGSNWLSASETIPPFSTFSFTIEIGETVDVTAEDCDGDTLDSLFEIYIPEEGVTITYSPN